MEKNIEITSSFNKSSWISFIQRNRFNVNDKVTKLTIDLSRCKFLEPFHVVSLACLIEEYFINEISVNFIVGENYPLNEYLSKLKLFDYWSANFNRNNFVPAEIHTSLNIWKISDQMIDEYSTVSLRYFQDNFQSDKDFSPISISLKELFNNIKDHSKSEINGFCISQYYPNLNKIKIALCDFGVGIAKSVNNYLEVQGESILEDRIAIKKAFEQTFSTKSTPQNRGMGLDILKGIVQVNGGSLLLISNSGYYKVEAEVINEATIKYAFIGTIIEVVLDTSRFHLKDDEDIDIEF